MPKSPHILAIESSCDDTSVAILCAEEVLSHVSIAQREHEKWGGVVPELASRVHLKNILPVLMRAMELAGVSKDQLDAVAATFGPGLMGSLLVGAHFAKGLCVGWGLPLIAVNHIQGHALSPLLGLPPDSIPYPYLSLIISGGHTQILRVDSPYEMAVLGQSLDDAVGEAFDKIAKMMGFPYPGGVWIDRNAKGGDPHRFAFTRPKVKALDFSFSGIKTQFLYFIRKHTAADPHFIEENKSDLCASIQRALVDILLHKAESALRITAIPRLGLGGGVSCNTEVRRRFGVFSEKGIDTYLPEKQYTTDNAAMIGLVAYHKFLRRDFSALTARPRARLGLMEDF